ncbi:MAG: iron-containing alcohol dehydrogenase [Treponema sp.]|jgi:alcohol dehydrogenase class IV|nr:iron-containing alcohol dehydrogenase [Treponema sp.]
MKHFSYFAPTEIVFGWGCLKEIGALAARYGRKALVVTGHSSPSGAALYGRLRGFLAEAGVEAARFDGVIPNPTTEVVSAGALMARDFGAELVIGLGGGSSMDTAKAVAVEASHPGTAWDYLHYTAGPTEKTLPVIAVGTTAGTGSQTTPCAVITNSAKKDKSAIWHKNIFPKIALVDPELTVSMPRDITAQTGFDAFCHNFEAYISVNSNPLTDALALDALGIIARALPEALADGGSREARSLMSWADTAGGMVIASAGVTLPHGLGMQIGGHCPQVSHGQSLAVFYPEFTRYTWRSAPGKFAALGRLLDPALEDAGETEAAERSCQAMDGFLKKIGLWIDLKSLGLGMEDVREIADCGQVLGDYRNNPRVASVPEMYEMLMRCYER